MNSEYKGMIKVKTKCLHGQLMSMYLKYRDLLPRNDIKS